MISKMTVCTTCKLDKGTDFRKSRKVCRECDNALAREKRKKDKEREKPEYIICNKCGEKKTDFRFNRKSCADCERTHGKEYRRTTDKAKIWNDANKERMIELRQRWYDEHKTEIKDKLLHRLKTDNNFRLAVKSRAGVRTLLKRAKPGGKSKYVNCTSERMRDWFRFQFSTEMTWENHGSVWSIDHVIPIHTYLSGEVPGEAVFDWLNVSPVPKKSNLSKNKYVDKEECQNHLEKAKVYLKIHKLKDSSGYLEHMKTFCESHIFAKHLVAGSTLAHTNMSENSESFEIQDDEFSE